MTSRVLRGGFVVGVTNPKMLIFLAAALPQFVDRGAGRVPLQMLFLGVLVAVIALVSDSVWALAAGTARAWFARSPRRIEVLGATRGPGHDRRRYGPCCHRPKGLTALTS